MQERKCWGLCFGAYLSQTPFLVFPPPQTTQKAIGKEDNEEDDKEECKDKYKDNVMLFGNWKINEILEMQDRVRLLPWCLVTIGMLGKLGSLMMLQQWWWCLQELQFPRVSLQSAKRSPGNFPKPRI